MREIVPFEQDLEAELEFSLREKGYSDREVDHIVNKAKKGRNNAEIEQELKTKIAG